MTTREDILAFLRQPEKFAGSPNDPEVWLAGLEDYALRWIAEKADRPLRPAQEAAWRGLAQKRAGLVLGPPGTGKTHLLSWLIAGYAPARAAVSLPARTFVTAFTRNAIGNVLDAVGKRQSTHEPNAPRPIYYGVPPAGLSSDVDIVERGDEAALLDKLGGGRAVVGATVWSLYRLLSDAGGRTAQLFDLICIDEASQMVLGHGLMALGGLAPGGRVVVSGDDQQLPPVRAAREVKVAGREVGGSLYAFMKSANAAEFALEETFRLNAPLAAFPERKFYPGQYFSADPKRRLALREGWQEDLDLVARSALDPAFPVVVLLHDGPPSATSNPFEASLAARLASALADRVVDGDGRKIERDRFWRDVAAVVSPHRAQNAAIRRALPDDLRAEAFVETVDRIQGKERDGVILSYCVGDSEFALAEAEFIFSPERLNVATTRARFKLIVILSRRLLEAVPAEQEVMENAEILREFVFSCEPMAETTLDGPSGRRVHVQIRARGFDDETAQLDLTDNPAPAEALPELTPELEGVLTAIRRIAAQGKTASVSLGKIRQALARKSEPFAEVRTLHRLGWVSLEHRNGRWGQFWSVRPFDESRRVYPPDIESVRSRIEVIVRDAKSGRHTFYDRVRDRFVWMTASGDDAFLSVLRQLEAEGLVTIGATPNGALTVSLPQPPDKPIDAKPPEPLPALTDTDFELLNRLEDLESARINFGVAETWTSIIDLARKSSLSVEAVAHSLARLEAQGHVMLAQDGRVRSRVAELAREIRHVKQRFRSDDAHRRPYLVRSLKTELKDREKPIRNLPLGDVLARAASEANAEQCSALHGLERALRGLWGKDAALAAFQERGLRCILAAWRGDSPTTFAIAADTGSGKTEAACLPLIAGAFADRLAGIRGVRAVLAYPRIRLVANQAQRFAAYLAACAASTELPVLTLGLQVKDVPNSFTRMHRGYAEIWPAAGPNAWRFPFFACPTCGDSLDLHASDGKDGADALVCVRRDWRFDGWVGSKDGLRANPPALFLPTTDSLHQWMHDFRAAALFGDNPQFAPPRALLADEIHLYTHIHGAQVGLSLRRLAARARINDPAERDPVAIGMSATIGDPARAWSRLIGRDDVHVIRPEIGETDQSPRGREYFFFIQPEVESRGADIAGASTTIQSLMCLGHGMRKRSGADGGYRALVFFDSIDKMRRLHGAYLDAEQGRELASFRINAYGDDAQGAPRTECCREPIGCDRFRDGECWWFAANDTRQCGAGGPQRPGSPLRVSRTPIYSGTSGDAEALVKGADVVFATSSLEVGYDDPDITLVYQHYAPQNLASFVQRKGRGGRGVDDRPLTAVTLSIYSPRDTWWFRRPREMVSPSGFEAPINPDNAFVRRGQALSALLDGLARYAFKTGYTLDRVDRPTRLALEAAAKVAELALGRSIWTELGFRDVHGFWSKAWDAANTGRATSAPLLYFSDARKALDWMPDLLFDTINLPALAVSGPDVVGGGREDVSLAFATVAPGNATRRYNSTVVHWRPPVDGRAPWLAADDYRAVQAIRLAPDTASLLAQLPCDARESLDNLHVELCRPTQVTLEKLGWMAGAHWTGELGYAPDRSAPIGQKREGEIAIRHDSRGELSGFLLVDTKRELGHTLESDALARGFRKVQAFAGEGAQTAETGLKATRVYWGADAELRLDAPNSEPIPMTQVFVGPRSGRPLLHGYQVETEGLRFEVDTVILDAFVGDAMARMRDAERERRWRAAQFTRYLIESRARGRGLDAYKARQGADLLVAAAGDPDLRKSLQHLLRFWSTDALSTLFEEARARLLHRHPLMTAARVAKAAAALSDQSFQSLIRETLQEVGDEAAMAGYLRSVILHGLAIRLKELVAHIGQGDERRLLAHVKLPIQFGRDSEDAITVCEAGSHGDGTVRSVVERWPEAVALWSSGFASGCSSADEDAVLRRFWTMVPEHERWRSMDPRDPAALGTIAGELLQYEPIRPLPAPLIRILFDIEVVEAEAIPLYDIARAFEEVRQNTERRIGRAVLDWELATAAVDAAVNGHSSALQRLHEAYGTVDAGSDSSLAPEARLAEQAYRLAAPLCTDGCRGCVQQSSDLMNDSLTAASVSRQLLQDFMAAAARG